MNSAQKLLVFLHVAVKQRAFQEELEAALPGIEVTAVGRIADFDRALKEGPDAVLTLPVVLLARGLDPKLRGRHLGAADEAYVLVGADKIPDATLVQSVGALDLLGREGTNAFVEQLLVAHPKVERVTKVEDLLPLLQMQRVDAILFAARLFPDLRASSHLSLMQKELTRKVELPALANRSSSGAQIMAAVTRLPGRLSSAVGVDEWR